jgi:quercetin dioxygenase-like cupin family protein
MRKSIVLLAAAAGLIAQSPSIQRTVIQRNDTSVAGREAVVARVEIVPGGFAGRHTHPGEEIGYVLDGELELTIESQPPRDVKAGESFLVPAGVKHNGHNKGASPLKFVSVCLVDKGSPLTTPVQ